MSLYSDGCATMVGNAGVDVKMPSNIRDEIVTVGVNVQALDKAIAGAAAAGRLPADFLTGWAAFKTEWSAFATAHSSWLSNMWYASYEKAVEYRKRLEDWRTRLEQLTGVKLSYPTPGKVPEGLQAGSGVPWKAIVWGGIAIGGLYGLSKLLAETRELKRELVGERRLVRPADDKQTGGGE